MFLPVELERGTKALQFDVCCEAIVQNFNCGCGNLQGYTNLHLLACPNQKNATEENLEFTALEQLKNMHIAPAIFIYPKIWLSKVKHYGAIFM